MSETIEVKADEKSEKERSSKVNFIAISSNFSRQESFNTDNFEIDKSQKVINWGKNNLLPDFLITMSKTKSTKHSAIISRKCKMIAGKGFEEPESESLKKFIENEHSDKDLNTIAKLVTNDYEVLNLYALGVRWNQDKTRITAIDYIPAHKVRKSTIAGVWKISDDWKDPKNSKSNTQIKQEFNTQPLPENFAELSDKKKKFLLNQIYVYKNTQVASEDYPTPNYAAGIDWILSDAGISTFTLNMIKKNFTGGYHINIATGIPEDDERKDFKRKFKKEYAGEDGDSIIITFSEPNSTQVPELKALPSTGNEDIYNNTEQRAQENIFIVHEVTNPSLFGIMTPKGLSQSKHEMQESLEIFQATYIDQRQEDVEFSFNFLYDETVKAKTNDADVKPEEEIEPEELKLKTYSLSLDEDKENAEGNKLAKNISKLPDNLQAAVIGKLNDTQILSLAGITPPEEAEKSEGDKIREAISSLSPLLATKVLEKMTNEQILSLAGIVGATKEALPEMPEEQMNSILTEMSVNFTAHIN